MREYCRRIVAKLWPISSLTIVAFSELEASMMPRSDMTRLPAAMATKLGALLVDVIVVTVKAFLSSLLGISTATVFAVFALVFMADLPLDLAVTAVALGMNAMLLSLVTLGNLFRNDEE
jgi:small-conductance mechanosensitive channel